jgi:ElaB/YqjD/DUF883 family membrane-anchored ribosome-binding protein
MEASMEKKRSGTEEMKVVETVQGLVSQNLDTVEAKIDSTVDSAKDAVHELRSEAQEIADRTLTRFNGFWGRMQEKADAQMAQHPWIILGTLLFVGYLLSRSQQSRRN